MLNGSVPEPPETLIAQLVEGGRLAAVLSTGAGIGSQGKAYLFVKVGGEVSGVPHFDAGARPLPGFRQSLASAFDPRSAAFWHCCPDPTVHWAICRIRPQSNLSWVSHPA